MIFVYILVSLAVFLGFVLYLSSRKKKIDRLFKEMRLSGEIFVLGPEMASYRGATAKYGRIKNSGVIGLTNEKIIFIPLLGKRITIPLEEIKDVSESRQFLGQHRANLSVLVLHAKDSDVGFFVRNKYRWLNAIRGIIR